MLVQKSRLSAYAVYLIFSGVTSLSRSLILTVNMVYQVEVAMRKRGKGLRCEIL